MFCHLGLPPPPLVLAHLGALGVHQGGVTLVLRCDAVRGGGAEREQWCPLPSPPDLVTPSATHNQTGPLWCWFTSGWACAHSRPLWVSPATSPVRLGVSPAAAPTPTGVFNQRFEALFPQAGALGWAVCLAPPPFPPVYLCENVGPQVLLPTALPALFVPQSATSLGPATLPRVLSALAAHPRPSYWSG